MGRRTTIALALVGAWMVGSMIVAAVVVPSNWTDRNVPAHLRADRWELTPDGHIARTRMEDVCGEMPLDVWIDAPAGAERPVLLGADEDMTRCFDENVAPAFPINGF